MSEAAETVNWQVKGLSSQQRLDKTLRAAFPDWGRKAVGGLITAGAVSVNAQVVRLASWQVRNGDRIVISRQPSPIERGPDTIDPAWILADDGAIIAINKPDGLLSEANRWGQGVNLLTLAQAHFDESLTLFHRLDRDTSGVMLLTRHLKYPEINRELARAFQERTVEKTYFALVGWPNQLAAEGEIRKPLGTDPARRDRMVVVRSGGDWASTNYRTEPPQGSTQAVWLYPATGRTHQLRVHLASEGAAVLGDRLYGEQDAAARLMLHAHRIRLPAEVGAAVYEAAIPEVFGAGWVGAA